jgi:hypothetical protein
MIDLIYIDTPLSKATHRVVGWLYILLLLAFVAIWLWAIAYVKPSPMNNSIGYLTLLVGFTISCFAGYLLYWVSNFVIEIMCQVARAISAMLNFWDDLLFGR